VAHGYCAPCYHQVTKEEKWPIGLRVWVAWEGDWHSGLIETRPSNNLAGIRLDDGRLVESAFSHGLISSAWAKPSIEDLPRSRRAQPRAGQILKLFTRSADGCIEKRRPDVWSSKADACRGCGRTDKPHEARGLCHRCYAAWRYRTNYNSTAEKSRRRAKAYRLRTDYDARDWERKKSDPRQKEWHRKASLNYARKHAKWPIGSLVRTSLGNIDLDDQIRPRLSRSAKNGHPYLTGRIKSTSNASAIVQFDSFTLKIPFARLEKVREEAAA